MREDDSIEILNTPEYGVVLKIRDQEVADQFEDFLTESCYVLFQTKFDQNEVFFYFGQAASTQNLKDIYGRFVLERGG